MATIQKIDKTYRVQIRTRNKKISRNFVDKETAELWAWYKENIYKELADFNPPENEMISIEDAILAKVEQLKTKDSDYRSISEVNFLIECFETIKDLSLGELTVKMCSDLYEEMMKTPVYRGRHTNNSSTYPSKVTIIKRFKLLAGVYSFMAGCGIDVENIPQKFYKVVKE